MMERLLQSGATCESGSVNQLIADIAIQHGTEDLSCTIDGVSLQCVLNARVPNVSH